MEQKQLRAGVTPAQKANKSFVSTIIMTIVTGLTLFASIVYPEILPQGLLMGIFFAMATVLFAIDMRYWNIMEKLK